MRYLILLAFPLLLACGAEHKTTAAFREPVISPVTFAQEPNDIVLAKAHEKRLRQLESQLGCEWPGLVMAVLGAPAPVVCCFEAEGRNYAHLTCLDANSVPHENPQLNSL